MDTNLSILKFFRCQDFVADQKFFDLLKKIAEEKYFYYGEFSLIDHNSLTEVNRAIEEEIPESIRYCLWNGKALEFPNIFICTREPTEYVFRLDSRHTLNEIIQKNFIDMIHFSLNCVREVDTHVEYVFYVIQSKEILFKLFDLFYNWLDAITAENIDD